MDVFTKWPDVYAIPSQEASTVADAPVKNFCRFGVARAAQRPEPELLISTLAGGVAAPEDKQDMDHPSSPAVSIMERCEDGRRVPEEGRLNAPGTLGREATHLPAGLQSINPRDHRDDARQPG